MHISLGFGGCDNLHDLFYRIMTELCGDGARWQVMQRLPKDPQVFPLPKRSAGAVRIQRKASSLMQGLCHRHRVQTLGQRST